MIFLLIGSAGLLIFYRDAMVQRLSGLISPHSEQESWLTRLRDVRERSSLKADGPTFEKLVPRSPGEVSVVQKRLIRAGYRKDSYVKIFYGAKVLVPLWLCVLAAVSGARTTVLSLFMQWRWHWAT